jgi:hypothetical protein
MPSFEFAENAKTADDKKFKGGNGPDEKLVIYGPTLSHISDEHGLVLGRPQAVLFTIERSLKGSGDLLLLRIAVDSQLWNNRDQKIELWPVGSFTFDRKDGNKTVPLLTHNVKRLTVSKWSLRWQGTGQNNLGGAEFTETVEFCAYRLKKSSHVAQNKFVQIQLDDGPEDNDGAQPAVV